MRAAAVVALLLAALAASADECSRLMTHYVQCVNRADDGTIVSIEVAPTDWKDGDTSKFDRRVDSLSNDEYHALLWQLERLRPIGRLRPESGNQVCTINNFSYEFVEERDQAFIVVLNNEDPPSVWAFTIYYLNEVEGEASESSGFAIWLNEDDAGYYAHPSDIARCTPCKPCRLMAAGPVTSLGRPRWIDPSWWNEILAPKNTAPEAGAAPPP